jgi:cytochrome c peroxidase
LAALHDGGARPQSLERFMSSATLFVRSCSIAAASVLLGFAVFGVSAPAHALDGAAVKSDQTTAQTKDEAELAPIELLGKRVFFDSNLSEPRGVSCASCHDPAKAFQSDNGSPIGAVSRGSQPDALGKRNAPSIMYASFSPPFSFIDKKDEETGETETIPIGGQFLDGRAADLTHQVRGPLLDPREMNNPTKRVVVEKVRDGAYAELTRQVYGVTVFDDLDSAFEKLAQAVAAFESSERFHPFSSKFDEFLRGRARLTPSEARGFELFKDPKKGNCLACHVGKADSRDPKDWIFTDFSYDALSPRRNMDIPDNKNKNYFDLGLCRQEGLEKIAPKGFDIESLCGAFKAPTLRNIAITGPYLHNGVFMKLRDVVAFYATRDTNPERWYPKRPDGTIAKYDDLPEKYHDNVNVKEVPYDRKPGQKPRLNDDEIDAIVAFLGTLTDRPPQ